MAKTSAFLELDENNTEHVPYIEEIEKEDAMPEVGYALTPKQLFHTLAERGRRANSFWMI